MHEKRKITCELECKRNRGYPKWDTLYFWRKRWDSNPRAREGYLISSQARDDHFDTLPYMLTPIREINAYSVF